MMETVIERLLEKHITSKKGRELTVEEMKMLMTLKMNENLPSPDAINIMYGDVFKASWQVQALAKRVEIALDYKFSKATLIFLLFIGDGVIGQCIVASYICQMVANKNKHKGIIDLDYLCMHIFPMGVPTQGEFSNFWDAQKNSEAPNGNMVDDTNFFKSILKDDTKN